jgi:hypothetical protein
MQIGGILGANECAHKQKVKGYDGERDIDNKKYQNSDTYNPPAPAQR